MFLPDWQPITVDLPTEWEFAHLYFVHDLHYGSELFDERKWTRLKNRILSDKCGKVLFIGDLFENAIPGSKSDMFTQTANPAEQKEFVAKQFVDKISGIVPSVRLCAACRYGRKVSKHYCIFKHRCRHIEKGQKQTSALLWANTAQGKGLQKLRHI